MSCTAVEFVKQAKVFIDVKEGSTAHKGLVDIYNSFKPLARGYTLKYTDAWCAAFVSVISILTGMTDKIPTEVGAHEHFKLMKKLGRVSAVFRDIKVGDIIYYDWNSDGHADHVGICAAVNTSNKTITVIEGNNGDAVRYRIIAVNNRTIYAIAHPEYNEVSVKGDENMTHKEAIEVIAKEVIEGKYGNYPDRIQNIYNEVQNEVNKLLKK